MNDASGAAQSHPAASSMAASTNSGMHASAVPDPNPRSMGFFRSGLMPTNTADSIIIDSTSPWDGPHPGLAAENASFGSAHRVRRAPIGMVRLPASLLAPRCRGVRPPRPPRGVDGGSSRQPVSDTHRLVMQTASFLVSSCTNKDILACELNCTSRAQTCSSSRLWLGHHANASHDRHIL